MDHSNQIFLFALLLTSFTSAIGSGIQRSTTLALPGTVLNFTCECHGIVIVVFNNTFLANGNPEGDNLLAEKDISFEKHVTGSGSYDGYDIKIVASYENSGTFFTCHYPSGQCPMSEHHIYTISGPPSPPESPSVLVKDRWTLAVSWTAPWSFPISHYTLRMVNASSSKLVGLWVTNHTELTVRKTWASECDPLIFTVEAFTDVGPSGPSQPITAGFPTTLEGQELVVDTQLLELTSTEVTFVTAFQVPAVCPYELVTFTIIALNQNTLSGSEIWGIVDVSKKELAIRQVAVAGPGDVLSVNIAVSNSLDEHLQQINVLDIQRLPETSNKDISNET